MKKRRITLNLDEDIVEALETFPEASLSAAANRALRHAIAGEAHRRALSDWLGELDAEHGPATPVEQVVLDTLLAELAE
jgi:hypothetical protein